jgi:hypothetical protein
MISRKLLLQLFPYNDTRAGTLLALLTVVLGGLALRAVDLSAFAVTHWDEGAIWASAIWVATLGADSGYHILTSPPLVPSIHGAGVWLFGPAPAAVVWLSVLASTLSIVFLYALVKTLASQRTAIIAAAMFAGSGLHVMYARSLLTEPFYVLLMLAALIATINYLATHTFGWLLAAGVTASLLQLTKYNGYIVAAPLVVILAYQALRGDTTERRRAIRDGISLGGLISITIAANLWALVAIGGLRQFMTHYADYVVVRPASFLDLLRWLLLVMPLPTVPLAAAGLLYSLWKHRSVGWTVIHLGCAIYVAFTLSYTFYLRLLAPVSIFVIIYAALMLDGLLQSRRRLAQAVAVLAIAAIAVNSWRDIDRYVVREFGGYVEAAQLINDVNATASVLLIAQQNVWTDLEREVTFLPSEPPVHLDLPGEVHDVYLVADLYAYYKYGLRAYVELLAGLDDRLVARITNPLAYDMVANTLTMPELVRFHEDDSFRQDILSIRVYRMTRCEAETVLTTAGGSGVPSVDDVGARPDRADFVHCGENADAGRVASAGTSASFARFSHGLPRRVE